MSASRAGIAGLLLATAMLCGCVTSYGPRSFTGGYSETRLGEGVYRVTFSGNGHTSRDKVWNYWIYRCAELTRQMGYSHFMLLKADEPIPQPQPAKQATAAAAEVAAGDPLAQVTPTATHSAPIILFMPSGTPSIRYTNVSTVKMVNDPAAYPGRAMVRAEVVLKMLDAYVKSAGKQPAPSEPELLKVAVIQVPGPTLAARRPNQVTLDDLKYLLPAPGAALP